jgi:uncharacterized flavoprotein (TIGR03862 family)
MSQRVAIIGAGPAGLMAADALLAQGFTPDIYDAMPSVGRKFLLAGRGGLNLTHAEPLPTFIGRYGETADWIGALVSSFTPEDVRAFAAGLGVETFVGTSGRVFPTAFKAAPLLRAWVARLRAGGARIHARHRWTGWSADGALRFETPGGVFETTADATLLALGGASWRRLGSDGAWVPWLGEQGIEVASLRPSNCGFDIGWSAHFAERFAGAPLKPVALGFGGVRRIGECVVTASGLEGGVVYALSAALREAIARDGFADLHLDLAPDREEAALAAALARPRGRRSLATHLRRALGLDGVKAGLLREVATAEMLEDPASCARLAKSLPLRLVATRPLDEAISSAGGVCQAGLDNQLMLKRLPGVFCAGEMLDWEAPTGGYLLTACLATGRAAGLGVAAWLKARTLAHPPPD